MTNVMLDPDELRAFDESLARGEPLSLGDQRLLIAMYRDLASQHNQIESVLEGPIDWDPIRKKVLESIEMIVYPPGLGTDLGDPDDPYIQRAERARQERAKVDRFMAQEKERRPERTREHRQWTRNNRPSAPPGGVKPLELLNDPPPPGGAVEATREEEGEPAISWGFGNYDFTCPSCGAILIERANLEDLKQIARVFHCRCDAYSTTAALMPESESGAPGSPL